jgi:hypothetical protein
MKTIRSFLIAGVLLLMQSVEAGDGRGGTGSRSTSSTATEATAPAPQNNPSRPAGQQQGVSIRRGNLPQGSVPPLGQTQRGQNQNQTNARNSPAASPHSPHPDSPHPDRHEPHDRDWWRHHYPTIVIVLGGYYCLDGSYWYPAYGYDPNYVYEYDGPIYAYGNLLPDQVIEKVQTQLQGDGYYSGPITGSLDPATRAAIANYQRDHGLPVTATIDQSTVQSLGLV